MYLLREEYFNFFKEIRRSIYAEYLGCDPSYISSILNGSKACSELVAKSIICARLNITIKDPEMQLCLDKYFVKER